MTLWQKVSGQFIWEVQFLYEKRNVQYKYAIKDFVFKDKDKDMEPEDEDLQKQQRQRLGTEDKD